MPKQQETFLQQFVEFITQFDSNPFQDYYIMLIFRFIIYLYLFIKLSDILMGYQKPNIKTRVLRKFQIVYGSDILKQMDNQDIQQLQVTISNTILNATKELKPKSHQKTNNDSILKDSGLESERRSLKVEEMSELSGSSLSKKSSKLKFDLQRNQYYDPPTGAKTQPQKQRPSQPQQVKQLQIHSNLVIQSQQVQGQSQEQTLSPTSQSRQFTKINKPYFQQQTSSTEYLKKDTQQQLQQANTKYPEQQINTMDLEIEQKQAKQLQNLLHLSDDMLNNSLKEKNQNQILQQQQEQIEKNQYENLQSVFKNQSTNITENYQQDINV